MQRPALLPYFRATLAALALAALTAMLLRGALVWGWDLGASLVNVRHAHSHTMFFAWITPALLLLVVAREAAARGRRVSRGVVHAIGAALLLGALTHPLFLRFGYSSVEVLGARLPLAAIVSGLAVLSWYAFVALFARESRGAPRTGATLAWRLALGVLVVSTLAVWPLALLRPLGLDAARWAPVLSHAFLDPFSEGFLVLAVLGLAHAEARPERPLRAALVAIAIAAPLSFPMGLAREALPAEARALAAVASVVWGVALLAQVSTLARGPLGRASRWRVPLALGALAAVAKIAAGALPWIDWASLFGLRLLYLHALLLGFATLGTLAAARAILGPRGAPLLSAVQASAILVIASLVPLSELWPGAWSGRWTGAFAAASALVAAVVLAASFAAGFGRSRIRAAFVVMLRPSGGS